MAEKEKLLQWHAAFYAGLQIELNEEAEHLTFENEHMLGTKPLQLDVLVIKKTPGKNIKKNIGRIFRTYNIIEYKSPEDYVCLDDFYKTLAYACLYKTDTRHVNEIKIDELTITLVCSRFPRKMAAHLRKYWGLSLIQQEPGIYYVNDGRFPIQLLITQELSEDSNLWLRNLTNNLKDCSSAERLIQEYRHHKKDKLYSSVMDIIVRANAEKFGEVRKMCDALLELMKDDLDAREKQGFSNGFSDGFSDGGMKKLEEQIYKKLLKSKTIEQIADELETELEEIQPIYDRVKAELTSRE